MTGCWSNEPLKSSRFISVLRLIANPQVPSILSTFLSIFFYLDFDPFQKSVSQHERQVLLLVAERKSNVLPPWLQLVRLGRQGWREGGRKEEEWLSHCLTERNTFLHAESHEAPKNGGKEGGREEGRTMRLPRVSLATVKSRWRAATSSGNGQSRIQHRELREDGWQRGKESIRERERFDKCNSARTGREGGREGTRAGLLTGASLGRPSRDPKR